MKVAFQGVPGAYSEMAGIALFGKAIKTLPCETFEGVFEAVRDGKAQRGIIPIENSLAGSIHINYDLLVKHDLHIIGEHHLPVAHALLALPGVKLSQLKLVRSHPQALAQCSDFFESHPKIKPEVFFDTAGAARSLSQENNLEIGAIASEYAAELYGLTLIRRGLQNQKINFTRFLGIARKGLPAKNSPGFKTSLAFRPFANSVGILHVLLGIFAEHGINLSKIESRPDPLRPFEYRFHLDLDGGLGTPAVKDAIRLIRDMVAEVNVYGSYPAGSLLKSRPQKPGKQKQRRSH